MTRLGLILNAVFLFGVAALLLGLGTRPITSATSSASRPPAGVTVPCQASRLGRGRLYGV
jgi:hypothetical protein